MARAWKTFPSARSPTKTAAASGGEVRNRRNEPRIASPRQSLSAIAQTNQRVFLLPVIVVTCAPTSWKAKAKEDSPPSTPNESSEGPISVPNDTRIRPVSTVK
jgi:hypothetical protein